MRSFYVLMLWAVLSGIPIQALPPEGDGEAVDAINATLAVENALLTQSLREYERLVLRRDETAARLLGLQQALDSAVGDVKASESGRLDQLIDQVQRVAGERDTLFRSESKLLERISERRKRISLLTLQTEALEGRARKEQTGVLTGRWDLVLMPVEQRGTCKLEQNGAVVNGTYELAGGWTGSLQGTLVDRKLYLVRIDTKLGKMMEFEGFLSQDETRIRGTWLNYELAGAEGSTGQWTAERRAREP
jgi:hypothetical protein